MSKTVSFLFKRNWKKAIAKRKNLCYNSKSVRCALAPTLGCRQAVRHQTLTLAFVGSNPAIPAKLDPLAQLAEQLPFKQWVRSSNLRRVTKKGRYHLGSSFFDYTVRRFEDHKSDSPVDCQSRRLDGAKPLFLPLAKMQTNLRRVMPTAKMQTNLRRVMPTAKMQTNLRRVIPKGGAKESPAYHLRKT